MSINFISRIFSDYHKGKNSTNGHKYRYTPPVWGVWYTKEVHA